MPWRRPVARVGLIDLLLCIVYLKDLLLIF